MRTSAPPSVGWSISIGRRRVCGVVLAAEIPGATLLTLPGFGQGLPVRRLPGCVRQDTGPNRTGAD